MKKIKKLYSLFLLAIDDLQDKTLGKIFVQKPITLNLLVNDVCNSRCQMCLIWQNKKDKEISANDLEKILQNDLFTHLKYIGVSGGEPTLRNDLPEIFKAICLKKPRILGTGIITNGIIENTVKQRILECAEICQSYGVSFNVMVSLDGLGEVHNTVRGRKNNFESAISLLKFFHEETEIPTSFGCTITSSNALFVDELLDYAKEQGIYGRFRIAEFIDRLYNNEQTEYIRAFEDKVKYHIGLFFFRAEHEFENNPTYQKTYRNIRKMIAEEKPRSMGCPYQRDSVVLTSRGDLLYCSPKSPILGNTLQSSANKIYYSNIEIREKIINNDCKSCVHDYHEPITFQEKLYSFLGSKRKQVIYNCQNLINKSSRLIKQKQHIEDVSLIESEKILIVGWYGTETVGDKAILWSIVEKLKKRTYPPKKIYLSSLYPFISQWTIKEIELNDLQIVETYSKEFEKICLDVNEIIVGGGPLMDIEPLDHLLYAFIQGTKNQAINRIEGCGIGPLVSPLYTNVVSEILRLADHISLRDIDSTKRCKEEFKISQVQTIPDPATNYVINIKEKLNTSLKINPPLGLQPNIACFLREWGKDYANRLTDLEYNYLKKHFEIQLKKLIVYIAQNKNADVHFLPMHSFFVGGDDRIFNRYLVNSIQANFIDSSNHFDVKFTKEPISPLEIIATMYHAKFNICMRFHSVLFAEILGVPYLAIDYTQGGKIKAFLEDKGKLEKRISLQEIAEGRWKEKIIQLL